MFRLPFQNKIKQFKMRRGNPVETIAAATYAALAIHLPDIEYLYKTPQEHREGKEGVAKTRRPSIHDVAVYHFPQTWGSGALGFGGMGTASVETAYTTVVLLEHLTASVFFDGMFAYTCPATSADFVKDFKGRFMASVRDSKKYYAEPTQP